MAPSTSGPGNDPGISATCPAAAPQPTSCPQRCPSTRSCPTPQPQQQPCQPCGSAAPGPSDCAIPIIEQATATVLTNIRVQRKLRFDWCYLTSKSGILKILEILVLILGLVAAHFYKELMKPFGYTAMVALVLTLLLLILYLIHFIEKLELLINAVLAVGFGGLGIWLITRGVYWVAVASMVAFLLYGYDAVLKCIGVQNYAIAQGERTVVTKTTHFTGPATNVPPLTSSMINIPAIQICTSNAKAKPCKASCSPCNKDPCNKDQCNKDPCNKDTCNRDPCNKDQCSKDQCTKDSRQCGV
ncbi:unnamed protein product [Bemisia tabaci]|uniref:Uncharacterized protein n=1 Tax=Bemisia tabaci TaxID=7038 RepID=A0A9P0A8S9_BEMTA|nr:unnamed protein product [Bemisia tabaci]